MVMLSLPRIFDNAPVAYLTPPSWCTAEGAVLVDPGGLTEERQILNRWTEYCSKLYNYKANGAPSVLNCPQRDAEDDQPILRREGEAAVQSLKKGKSAGVDNIPAELV